MTEDSKSRKIIHVASRKSVLAMAQTNEVIEMLQKLHPDVDFVVGQTNTLGDQVQDRHLSDLGTSIDSGLFTKSLEESLINKTSDFAVHSLKDMPTTLPPGLVLATICKRASPEDAVIIHPKHKRKNISRLEELPEQSIIGTSSLRREALLRQMHPSFRMKTIRGNIQTRLSKLDDHSEYDAIVVAACGFRRGGLGNRIDQILPSKDFGYGVGQGSIGIECRADDTETLKMLRQIEHHESALCCKAERSLLYHLEGGCQISMGVHTTLHNGILTLTATVLSRDGTKSVEDMITGPCEEAVDLGEKLARRFLANNDAIILLGKIGKKRPLTYGDIEAPGDAAAAAKKMRSQGNVV
ncbi:unnamed protein product [Albugo candida]|uniref:hydroxymethylbilane synthase n=3 Tax=Albugo candida TaxID=65357 RepID=A0A024GHA5_9STRA|nr:unnamed protein product [Albugo candida]|eukprot:CCI45727.1 unnamed protein product [Albugo candida]